jgi:DNA-directed RNA polymerase specialized sigma subunit
LPIEDVITLQKAFVKLKELQRNIAYYLFVMDLRKTKAAQKLGLSQRRADQIKKDISNHLS